MATVEHLSGDNPALVTFNGKSFTDWQALGFDKASKSGDPMFVSATDYHLTAASPCIDAGNNATDITSDFAGTVRPQDGKGSGKPTLDIGAYEFKK